MPSKLLKVILFFSAGFGVLYLVFANQNKSYQAECAIKGIPEADCSLLHKLFTDFTSANVAIIAFSVLLFMLSNIFRALRWNMLIKPLGTSISFINSLGAIMMAYLANLAFPRAGEVVRAGVISKYEDISFDKSFGTIVTDRIVDVFCLLGVFILTMALAYKEIYFYFDANFSLEQKFGFLIHNPITVFLILATIAGGLLLLWNKREKIKQSPFGEKVAKFIKGLLEGVTSILKLDNVPLFIIYSLAIWLLYFLMTFIVFKAFAPTAHLGMVAGLVVFLFGSLGIVFPSPGGMGSYHFLIISALAIYGINGSDGFSFANLVFFSIQVFGNLIFGITSIILLPWYNKRYGRIS